MSGWSQLAPYGASAIGNIMGGSAAARAGDANAAALRNQAITAQAQSQADADAQRRMSSQVMGQQAAAIGQAGIGSGGTAAGVIQQSASMAALDALNIQYQGRLKRAGLMAQARSAAQQGTDVRNQSYMLAGTSVLKGVAQGYKSGLLN